MTLLLVAKLTFNPQVLRWMDRLHALGLRVVCLHIGSASELTPIRSRIRAEVHCLFKEGAPQGGLRCLGSLFRRYRDVLDTGRPDAVWVLCLWTLLVPLVWALKSRAIPLVVTACGSDVNTGARRWRNRILFRYVLSKTNLVCTTTPEMMARLLEFANIPAESRLALYWGIDTDLFNAPSPAERATLRERWGIDETAPTIFMGRILRPIAYYREALAAIDTIVRTGLGSDLRLIFADCASDPVVLDEVRQLLAKYGLTDQTIFVGRELGARELREAYAVSDLALNLLSQDQLGATILESIAVGCLVVTTDLPQYRRVAAEGLRLWFVRSSHVEADLTGVLSEILAHVVQAKRGAIEANQQLVRRKYRFDDNSLRFVNAIRSLCGKVSSVHS